jgi:adenylate kinase
MKIILLGPPGAGKGTQANYIKQEFNIPQISTGDMLRAEVRAGTPRGMELKKIMDAGELVSDELILDIIKVRITADDCRNGYLFDGFPRTVAQADGMMSNNIDVEYVVELWVEDEEIIRRMSGRRIHPQSGRSYHVLFNPPRQEGKDDVTGEPLIQRDDDSEATVRKRLQIYHTQTSPLIHYYSELARTGGARAPKYYRIGGDGTVEQIRDEIISRLKNAR